MNSISTFDITKYPLLDILKDIKTGRIQLPDFQRDWVWDDAHVRRVLASISMAYPIGAVMLLQQGNHHQGFKPRPLDGVTLQGPPAPGLLILDGQQRLTTLFMVLLSEQPVLIKDSRSNKRSRKWYYLDLKKALAPNTERSEAILAFPESKKLRAFGGELIDVSTPENEYAAGLFPLSKVFGFLEWRSKYSKYWQYDTSALELINALEMEVIKKFEHYQMPVIQLRESLPKEAVCQVFEDTNTSGCDLNFFDLMTASYCAGDFSLRDDWQQRETRLKSHKLLRLLRNTDFIQAVTLVATYARHQKALENGCPVDKLPAISCRRSSVLQLSTEEYMSWAESVTRGFEEAARFLHGQKIFDANDLAYPIQLAALAAIFTVSGEHSSLEMPRKMLSQWFWCGVFGEMYTVGTDARVARDLLEVSAWLSGGKLPSTNREANFTTSRLHAIRRRQGAVYKGLSVLLRREGAVDWSTGEEINDVLYFEEQIDSHHIFPVAWCRKQGIDPSKYNCLVNRTPLTAKTNRVLGGEAPSIYLKQFSSYGTCSSRVDEMLRSHAIDPTTLRRDDFEGFFAARTRALMKLIEEAMGKCLTVEPFQESVAGYKNGNGNGLGRSILVNN